MLLFIAFCVAPAGRRRGAAASCPPPLPSRAPTRARPRASAGGQDRLADPLDVALLAGALPREWVALAHTDDDYEVRPRGVGMQGGRASGPLARAGPRGPPARRGAAAPPPPPPLRASLLTARAPDCRACARPPQHLDYLWGLNARRRVYDAVLGLLGEGPALRARLQARARARAAGGGAAGAGAAPRARARRRRRRG